MAPFCPQQQSVLFFVCARVRLAVFRCKIHKEQEFCRNTCYSVSVPCYFKVYFSQGAPDEWYFFIILCTWAIAKAHFKIFYKMDVWCNVTNVVVLLGTCSIITKQKIHVALWKRMCSFMFYCLSSTCCLSPPPPPFLIQHHRTGDCIDLTT